MPRTLPPTQPSTVAGATVSELSQADALRKAGQWADACCLYQTVQAQQPNHAVVAHNLALCHLALGQVEQAVEHSRRAVQLQPTLWQSALVWAKALVLRNDKPLALALLRRLHAQWPDNADIRHELATLTLHVVGDAVQARALVRPLLGTPQHGRDAEITTLVTLLYDREPNVPAQRINQAFLDFGAQRLPLDAVVQARIQATLADHAAAARPATVRPRRKVGLLSPQFFASPVYFFAIGALRELAGAVDLVVFNRGQKSDWATEAFRSIATDWHDVASLPAEALAHTLARHQLDALIDLGGWMDPVALSALSAKPARKLYKWVGGQSVTTGLRSFDGFLTDDYQTPLGSDPLYSEPLVRLKAGYVTYMPPPYLPPAQPRPADATDVVLGVIANPAKVSRAFLADLAQRHYIWQQQGHLVRLRCVDYRYQHPEVRQRIERGLPGVAVEFVAPANHREYLSTVAQLDATLDTWPYSGGLTTIEALALGVPSYTRLGELFCERHTQAHCHYAGMPLSDYRIDDFNGWPQVPRNGHSLLRAGSPRVNHTALAAELLALLETPA
ncbi:hypothetical protein [Macromonas bipunctata]|uniref:hypothetical protein n=1 Tax=Macromonas bipunctata TaxID=183670 RepID=UPI000C31FB0B|nr:hypothetical protein [Macromonas bipunctata]